MMFEQLVGVYEVTAWKDGAVYKTEYVEDRWVDLVEGKSYGDVPEGYVHTPPVSNEMHLRRKKES